MDILHQKKKKALPKRLEKPKQISLFVAISSPKKKFLAKWRDTINIPFCMGVGGSFDVIAGKVKEAPKVLQNRTGMDIPLEARTQKNAETKCR